MHFTGNGKSPSHGLASLVGRIHFLTLPPGRQTKDKGNSLNFAVSGKGCWTTNFFFFRFKEGPSELDLLLYHYLLDVLGSCSYLRLWS